MKKIKTVFNILSIIFVIILIFWITQINFDDLSYKENSSPYLGILSMSMISIALQMIKGGIKEK
jgi:lipopolysaccharide export LptBFGC system permease protein LptF